MAAFEVIFNQAHSLHEGIARGGADKRPAAYFEILAKSDGFGGGREGLCLGPGDRRLPWPGLKLHKIGIEIAKLAEKIESAVGVVDGGEDLAAMADDAGVKNEAFDVGVAKLRNLIKIEVGKGRAEIVTLTKDGEPRKSGLKSLKAHFFEEAKIISHSPAPFRVVVANVLFIVTTPPTTNFTIDTSQETIFRGFHTEN